MKSRTSGIPMGILLMALYIFSGGCHARNTDVEPTIEFTKVPSAEEGGPDKLETIEGRVNGARPGQQIVLYAKSGTWWIQPMTFQPYTKIESDSTWKNSTHLGT